MFCNSPPKSSNNFEFQEQTLLKNVAIPVDDLSVDDMLMELKLAQRGIPPPSDLELSLAGERC